MRRNLLVVIVAICVLVSNIPFSAVATSTVLQGYLGNIDATVEISGATGGSLLIQALAIRLLQYFQPGTPIILLMHVFYLDGTPAQLAPEKATFVFYSEQAQSRLVSLENVTVIPQPGRLGYYTYNFTIPKDWPAGAVSVYVLAYSLHDIYGGTNSVDSRKTSMTVEVIAGKAAFNIASYTVPLIILILLLIAVLLVLLRSRKKKK